jgi:hypothetical protein
VKRQLSSAAEAINAAYQTSYIYLIKTQMLGKFSINKEIEEASLEGLRVNNNPAQSLSSSMDYLASTIR